MQSSELLVFLSLIKLGIRIDLEHWLSFMLKQSAVVFDSATLDVAAQYASGVATVLCSHSSEPTCARGCAIV
jgi:hypothetical protein